MTTKNGSGSGEHESGGGASLTTIPAAGSSTGTDIAVRDYVDTVVDALYRTIADMDRRVGQTFDLNDKALQAALLAAKEAVSAALAAAKEAVDKAEAAAGKRFEATNAFRGQLADQALTFQRVDVAQTQNDSLRAEIGRNREDIIVLQNRAAAIEAVKTTEAAGRVDNRASVHTWVGVVGGLVGFVALLVGIVIAVMP